MGIYTNHSSYAMTNTGVNYDYTSVEPFTDEHVNFHALGIQAATECAINTNSFMKAIALGELASVEQTGSEEMFYEGISLSGIFDKIKSFFKKIIEKIHKIFHTFIAKMSSWFQGSDKFAKKYGKEVIKGWSNVKNDWEFKGYNYKDTIRTLQESKDAKDTIKADSEAYKKIAETLNVNSESAFTSALNNILSTTAVAGTKKRVVKKDNSIEVTPSTANKGKWVDADGNEYEANQTEEKTDGGRTAVPRTVLTGDNLTNFRDKFNETGKDVLRKKIVEGYMGAGLDGSGINLDELMSGSGYDQKEFTEEIFKKFHGGEDSKQDLDKSKIEESYGGSISAMMTFIEDYNKIKKNIETVEKNFVKSIDNIIDALNKAENKVLKDKTNTASSEAVVQFSTVFQTFWGFYKECQVQMFSGQLQGLKDACVQAKEIAVKVIGQGKSMTQESYDYSNNSDGLDFISSVKLI